MVYGVGRRQIARVPWSPTAKYLPISFCERPVSTVAEAADRIEQLTGIRLGVSQTRSFLKKLGLRWQRTTAIPVPPKRIDEHLAEQRRFLADELKPRLEAAVVGKGHVFFVDAAHFAFGTLLCCLWSIRRLFVRAASGRQPFNVLGAWNAVTRELIAVTHTTVVNMQTICELLGEVTARGLAGPSTFVLDNARYQRNASPRALAAHLGITLLYLPSYSPNLNLIERLWKFIKRQERYGKYHARFDDFRAAIQTCLSQISTVHQNHLKSPMTLKSPTFENVSLLTA